jgi:hypothetical protein
VLAHCYFVARQYTALCRRAALQHGAVATRRRLQRRLPQSDYWLLDFFLDVGATFG